MNELPDSILLEVFSKLEFIDLCRCARVCQKWRMLTDDFTLKKIIIVKKPLQDKYLYSLINNHFTKHLEEFRLLKPKWNSPINPCCLVQAEKSCFWLMSNRSPNLRKLVLTSCSLPYVSISDLPSKILHLSIRESELSPSSFFGSKPHLSLPQLTCLDLGGCNNFLTSQDLHVLTNFKSLKALYFEGCFRINNGGIESLIEILPQLEVLDVEGTDISNEGVHFILDNGVKLKELFLGHTHIDDGALNRSQKPAATKWSYICVMDTQITYECLKEFLKISKHSATADISLVRRYFTNADSTNRLLQNHCPFNLTFQKCYHYLNHSCTRKKLKEKV